VATHVPLQHHALSIIARIITKRSPANIIMRYNLLSTSVEFPLFVPLVSRLPIPSIPSKPPRAVMSFRHDKNMMAPIVNSERMAGMRRRRRRDL